MPDATVSALRPGDWTQVGFPASRLDGTIVPALPAAIEADTDGANGDQRLGAEQMRRVAMAGH
jgi:hypothetical protein